MSITWLSSRSRADNTTEEQCRITFTTKPKGIRTNAVLTRAFREIGKQHFRFGYDEDEKAIHLHPVEASEEAFKIPSLNGSNGQVTSGILWQWAVDNDLEGARVFGSWHEGHRSFIFRLEPTGVAWLKPKG